MTGNLSSSQVALYCVPQGAVLGPLYMLQIYLAVMRNAPAAQQHLCSFKFL